MPDYILGALFVTTGLLLERMIFSLLKNFSSPVPQFFLHALAGAVALLAGNALCPVTGIAPGINILTLFASVFLGVPGVGLLWAVIFFV